MCHNVMRGVALGAVGPSLYFSYTYVKKEIAQSQGRRQEIQRLDAELYNLNKNSTNGINRDAQAHGVVDEVLSSNSFNGRI